VDYFDKMAELVFDAVFNTRA